MAVEQQVVIVGAGPAGLITALGLAQQGIDVTVLERAAGLQESPRAVTYHWSTLDGIERLGLFDDASKAGFLKQDYAYRVRKTGEIISYGLQALDGRVAHPYNLHLGQGALVEVVHDKLVSEHPNVRILWNHEVTGVTQNADRVTLALRTPDGDRTMDSRWVIGADGASSKIRDALDLGFDGMTWPERFVAVNLRFPDDRAGWAQSTFYVDDEFGGIFVKIDESGEHGLWRVTCMEDLSLPEGGVMERLPAYLGSVFGPDVADGIELDAVSPYRMHQRSASAYRAGRVLLAGDAAHITNPCGGLGLTMGMFDAFALIEVLGAVVRGRSDETLLDAYSDLRRSVYLDKASPRAAANKQLIFHSSDPVKLDDDLELFRRMAKDPELAADVLYFTKTLETPTLLAV